MRQTNRVPLAGPPGAYDAYRLSAPIQTHRRPATCAEVECKHHLEGWVTRVDEATTDGRRLSDGAFVGGSIAAAWIRNMSDRHYSEHRDPTGLTVFTFPAGQDCFRVADHTVPLEREPFYTRTRGSAPHAVTGYDRADQWVDDFAANQDRLSTLRGE